MTIRKLFLAAMCLALVNYVLPQAPAWAGDGVPATRAEEEGYAQREAQSKGLEQFVGGDALGLVIAILIIAALVVLIWYLIEHSHGHSYVSPKDVYPRPPGHAAPRLV
jgi:hypothetical protein